MTIKLTKEEVMKIVGEKLFLDYKPIKDIWIETGDAWCRCKHELDMATINLEVDVDEAL